jgi:hypothetical protein
MRTSLLSLPLLLKMSGGMRIFRFVVIIIIIMVTIFCIVFMFVRDEKVLLAMQSDQSYNNIVMAKHSVMT